LVRFVPEADVRQLIMRVRLVPATDSAD